MLQLETDIIARVLTQQTVRSLVGKNKAFSAADDQLAIRSGMILAGDPYPAIEINIVGIEHEKDLQESSGLQHATLEIRCLAFDKPAVWSLRNAVAYDGGDPNDPTRTTGLDKFRDSTKQIFRVGLRSDVIDVLQIPSDATDRVLWYIDTVYNVDFRERT